MAGKTNPFDTCIYVRVKRHQQTFFVLCDEFEEVAAFKGRILDMFTQTNAVKLSDDFSVDDIKLFIRNRILENSATCHDQQLFNDSVVYICLKKPNTKDEFEDLADVSGQQFEYEYPPKKKEEPVAQSEDN
ncbi:UNKNOWN [Stylonychia lemnae]|uniref:Uncharacterized protein n=1 Tax=Stylonychia lemnae TaxID=5949 RepID=A0A078B2R4_STYLE|nr:UNKNOWN [Stylonychia lemnae]|eukprot:CDW87793.1 UNKNOWN [Stylonychia lemnae]